jgi:fused signal recognition particle receptor
MQFIKQISNGLKKTRANIVGKLNNFFAKYKKIDDGFFDSLIEVLISCDIGAKDSYTIIESIKEQTVKEKIFDSSEVKKLLIKSIKDILQPNEQCELEIKNPSIILMIGVNGTGKTTSIAKLAYMFKNENKSVMLAAADTFRAAAVEQLDSWANVIGVPIIKNQYNSDPGAIVFDAIKSAKAHKTDILICDTAGRLHNKINLMNELKKIYKIIDKEYSNAQLEVFICLDAMTGQNALRQVEAFNEITNITGIVLTKLDTSAKGGIVVSICNSFKIPVRFIGFGERVEDFQKFDADIFSESLFSENNT